VLDLQPRQLLEAMYAGAVAGAMPDRATAAAIAALPLPAGGPVRLIALGKAAHPMTAAAVAALGRGGATVAGGVVVAPDEAPAPHPALTTCVGDHPVPRARSIAAADRIAAAVAERRDGETAVVLLSGGASSLAAAPEPGVSATELAWLYSALLGSGADIATMNGIRKRFARWSGGRLARALAPAPLHCLAVSDVLGDDPATIGSGPCAPDPLTAADVSLALGRLGFGAALPPSLRGYLDLVSSGVVAETPKPGDPLFARVSTQVVVSNRRALEAAAERAHALGLRRVHVEPAPLVGEASACGRRLVGELLARRARGRAAGQPECVVWGGEPTVTLSASGAAASDALGGRAQELALAAARALYDAGEAAAGITLLAAGTDGRDGPTDAAGAVVDWRSWSTIAAAGRSPGDDLAAHRAYHALDSAGALLRPGLTGTNVMDVVIGLA
jgi:glycerate 2-kinase